jgi:putative peptide zinc metalloprotease protein
MAPSVDLRIRELTNLRLTLREDLLLSPSVAAGSDRYVIEDPVTSKFYYVGIREYSFLSLLNGELTVGQALQKSATMGAGIALSEREAATLCRWLVDTQLVRNPGKVSQATFGNDRSERGRPAKASFNPLAFKLSLVNPDRFLGVLERSLSWLYGPQAFVGWLLMLLSAIYVVALHSNRLRQASEGILATDNWLWLGLSWLVLKLVHEISHGLACKRYGGNVREAGLMFMLFTPVAFVDMTSAWRFRSKWQRIHASVAGMYAELFVASVAAWVWAHAPDGTVQHIAFNIMVMASATTIAFNANPLMRFDGYYVLADWLEIPNLASHASQMWKGWARRFFLGLSNPPPQLPPSQRGIVQAYGLAALLWRTVVTFTLLLAASVMFHGAGIVLAATGAFLWWLVPVAKAVRSGLSSTRPVWLRLLLTTSTIGSGASSLFTVVPWFGPYRAPAVVEYSPLVVVRADSAGFVSQLLVQAGDRVESGQTLAMLDNPEQSLKLRELELNIERAELKSRKLKREGKLAEYQAEQDQVEALELKLREKKEEVEALTVRAPRSGIVMGRQLATLRGMYLAKGDEILSIGEEQRKELQVSLAQHDVQFFSAQVGRPLRISLGDGQMFSGKLDNLEPQASVDPPHAAFGANCGGPIPVVERRAGEGADEHISHEFLAPRFTGTVPLDASAASQVFSGQLGEVSFRTGEESFGGHFVTLGHRWLKSQLELLTKKS